MRKIFLALVGIAFLSIITEAQDLGRMRRLMLLRQRELALRRGGFPFGIRGVGGPGIPPPVAARLALIERQRGGSGNIFGQQPTQAEEFLETNRRTVEQRSRTSTDGGPPGEPPIQGFLPPNTETQDPRSEIQRMSGPLDGSQSRDRRPPGLPGDALPIPLRPPFLAPVLPLVHPQLEELRLPPFRPPTGPRRMPARPPRRRERLEAQRSRRPQHQSREPTSRGPTRPRVFPNVPAVVQIPSVTPGDQGQSVDGQVGLTQTGEGQMGGQMTGLSGGQGSGTVGGQIGGSFGGSMGSQIPGSMGGTMGGPMSGSMGGTMAGTMGGSVSGGSIGGGPMGGVMGGPMTGGPMGRPLTGPIGGSIGGTFGGRSMGGAMGGPMAGGPLGGAIGGSFGRQMGGPLGGPMIGPMRGPGAGPFGSPLGRPVGGSFGSQFTGPRFSFTQPSGGQFSSGAQTQGQGSAIFPSQATQGPVIRQRGPGFTTESSLPTGLDLSGSSSAGIPGFPNGPPLPFPGGAPGFGQSDPMVFPTSGFSPEVLSRTEFQSSGFPGFPAGSFGQRFGVTGSESSRQTFVPSFDASPSRSSTGLNVGGNDAFSSGQSFRPVTFGPSIEPTPAGQTAGQTLGGGSSQGQVTTSFGFVGPSNNAAAGPAFNTGSQATQNFNIQFQPLQPGTVPQIPAQQPNQGQMGIGGNVGQPNTGMTNDFSNQGNFQFGSSSQSFQSGGSTQGGLQFGGLGQGGIQTGNADQNSKFIVSGGPTIVETKTNQQSGDMTFGSNSQGSNNAAITVSERTVETGGAVTGNTEFRLVEVGNILGDKGLINNDAGSSTVVVTETTSNQQSSDFQPIGDINTAFRSFESVAGSNNVVDLSLEPTVTLTENVVSTPDATGSTIVTNKTETKNIMSVQDGPFAASINQDFSFFMAENNNNEAPNVMPPITFTAPQPPLTGPEAGPPVLTFAVEEMTNTGNKMPAVSSQEFSSGSNSFTISSGGKTVLGPEQLGTTAVVGETTPSSAQP